MVIVFPVQRAFTPVGKPIATPIPVAPVVEWVIDGINVLIHIDGVAAAAVTVLFAFTVIVPVAFTEPQPPVNGME